MSGTSFVTGSGQSVRFGTVPDVYARNFGDLLGEADQRHHRIFRR